MANNLQDLQQGKVMSMYALFGLGLFLTLVPHLIAAAVSGLLVLMALVMAYIYRANAEHGSLLENHMTFIIRTIWIGSFLTLLTLAAASFYLFKMLDQTPMMPCMNQFLSLGPASVAYGYEYLLGIFYKCWEPYWQKNLETLIIGTGIAAGLPLAYFAGRYIRGITRAAKGYRLANSMAWF